MTRDVFIGYRMAYFSSSLKFVKIFSSFHCEHMVASTVCWALAINFLFASGHNFQRCVEMAALNISAIFFITSVRWRNHVPAVPTFVAVLLTTFFFLGLISAIVSFSTRHAINEWSHLLLLIFLVFAITAELSQDVRRIYLAIYWIGIACVLYSLKLLFMYSIALVAGFQVDMHTLAIGFSNARFLNHTQTALLPFLVLLCLRAQNEGTWRKTWFILVAFWWALLFVTEARASILALTSGCVVVLALRPSHARRFIVTMTLTAFAGAVLYGLLFIVIPGMFGLLPIGTPLNVLERTAANPSSNRNILWNFSLELIAAHPWLGAGPQHFAHEAVSLNTGAHPHNWLLQLATEWGLPALLCLLGAVFIGARALILSRRRLAPADLPNQQMLVALLVACTAIFVDGLFSGVIVMPQSQLAIALVLGIAGAWVRLQGPAKQGASAQSLGKRTAISVVVATGLCGLLWSIWPDIARVSQIGAPISVEHSGVPEMQWPRMWKNGYF